MNISKTIFSFVFLSFLTTSTALFAPKAKAMAKKRQQFRMVASTVKKLGDNSSKANVQRALRDAPTAAVGAGLKAYSDRKAKSVTPKKQ